MLGSFVRSFVCIVHLLASDVSGKVLDGHDTGENCSAALNISSSLHGHGKPPAECPPWFTRGNESGNCRAGPTLNGMIQQDMSTLQTSIMQCFCMTEEDGVLIVGACLHECLSITPYYPLPCHVSQIQNFTCPPSLKRGGPLCTKCINGHAYPVYSYKKECFKCEHYKYNWLKYLAVAYLPLTIFYILVAMFSISFTSPLIIGLVMLFQLAASPTMLQFINWFSQGHNFGKFLAMYAAFASLLNLDFGRIYYTFCLNPTATPLELNTLDYGVVVFPVFLIFLTHFLVKLHKRGTKPIVWVWLAIVAILGPLRKQLKVNKSLIDVFASFLYLSSSRLLITSVNILKPVVVYYRKLDGELLVKNRVYSDPSLVYFGNQHVKFALLAIVMVLLFFVLPVILLFVYPFSCFQRVLNRTGLNSLALRTFIDVFQGHYKDGTNGTRDYRYFSVFPFLFPLVIRTTFILTQCSIVYHYASFFALLYIAILLVLRPFKQLLHNFITAAMLAAVVIGLWSMIINNNDSTSPEYIYTSFALLTVSSCIPFIYVVGLALKKLIRKDI